MRFRENKFQSLQFYRTITSCFLLRNLFIRIVRHLFITDFSLNLELAVKPMQRWNHTSFIEHSLEDRLSPTTASILAIWKWMRVPFSRNNDATKPSDTVIVHKTGNVNRDEGVEIKRKSIGRRKEKEGKKKRKKEKKNDRPVILIMLSTNPFRPVS